MTSLPLDFGWHGKLGFTTGGKFHSGRGVNADGTVCGRYSDNASTKMRPSAGFTLVRVPTGRHYDRPRLSARVNITAPATRTNATARRRRLQLQHNSAPNYEAFRWFSHHDRLGFLPGGTFSLANAVNADGSVVVGYSAAQTQARNIEAFRWFAAHDRLGFLPGGTYSLPMRERRRLGRRRYAEHVRAWEQRRSAAHYPAPVSIVGPSLG